MGQTLFHDGNLGVAAAPITYDRLDQSANNALALLTDMDTRLEHDWSIPDTVTVELAQHLPIEAQLRQTVHQQAAGTFTGALLLLRMIAAGHRKLSTS